LVKKIYKKLFKLRERYRGESHFHRIWKEIYLKFARIWKTSRNGSIKDEICWQMD